jgi:3-deoxy-manno-octulosonate cytidylyltransferase (CMP-KDO synthetase)
MTNPPLVVGVIPARFASTRFPGKPLATILNKPMLTYVIEAALKSRKLTKVLVATDHEQIAQLAERSGAETIMTDSDLPSGSDRAWQAVQKHSPNADIVVNIQGDEPLLRPELIDRLIEPLTIDRELQMTTLGRALQPGDLESLTTAKIVVNKRHEALYFSRLPIPYSRESRESRESGESRESRDSRDPGDPREKTGTDACLKHIGIYAYTRLFLETFCRKGPVAIELAEGLEQLRALYLGARIRVILVDHDSWGVDVPEDIAKVEARLRQTAKQ